jgi:ubiquinone/menaquinone biosynthesis C-methylase UbiE
MKDKQSSSAIKEIFDTVSEGYDHNVLRFFRISAEHFASILNLHGTEHVLDIAAGTGNVSLAISKYLPLGKITAVDISSEMLGIARKKAEMQKASNIEFKEMDMQSLQFPPGKFDAAICAFGIFFANDMAAQLRHISDKVKNGGTIAICCFRENYFQPFRGLFVDRLSQYNKAQPPLETLKQIATESGSRDLFVKAGIEDISIKSNNAGYFLKDENEWWNVIWNAGLRRMINQLSPVDLAKFKNDHLQEITALKTKDGIWLDVDVLYTIGKK